MTRTLAFVAIAAALAATPAAAQATHEIRLEADPAADQYRFIPADVTARRGDVLVFRAAKGGPHSVVFEEQGMPAGARAILSAALPNRTSELGSPLLSDGAVYRVTIPANLPPGRYAFYCLPHRAYDMRGELTVR
jgi:plastocyanin